MRVTPRASRDGIDGVVDGVLRLRVTAAPADGAANEAVLRVLATSLGVRRSSLSIVRGATARTKVVALDGITAEALRSRWPGLDV